MCQSWISLIMIVCLTTELSTGSTIGLNRDLLKFSFYSSFLATIVPRIKIVSQEWKIQKLKIRKEWLLVFHTFFICVNINMVTNKSVIQSYKEHCGHISIYHELYMCDWFVIKNNMCDWFNIFWKLMLPGKVNKLQFFFLFFNKKNPCKLLHCWNVLLKLKKWFLKKKKKERETKKEKRRHTSQNPYLISWTLKSHTSNLCFSMVLFF